MKDTLAVASIAFLCLLMFAGLTLWMNAQQFSNIGDPANLVTQLWNFKPAESQVSAPVVSDGYVYIASNEGLGSQGPFYCLKASTGVQVWNQTGLSNDFAVVNGYIYVSSGADLLCLNAFDGVPLWNFSHAINFGAPVVVGGIVYVGGLNNTSTPNDIGVVYALNASAGAEIWNYSGSLGTRFDLTPLVVSAGNVYAVSSTWASNSGGYFSGAYSDVYAFQASTGKELWNCTTQGWFTSLIAADNNIYVGCNYYNAAEAANGVSDFYAGGILAFAAQNGQSIWNYTNLGEVSSSSFAGGTVYFVSSSGVLYALNSSDGSVIWSYTAGTGLGSLVPVNGYLYVGSSYGAYCFNMSNGAILWNFATSDFADSSTTNPTYANGVIYVGWNGPTSFAPVTQNNFYALNALNGKVLWNYTLGYTDPSPIIVNGIVYVGADFVTTRSPDFEGPGVVLALKPEETSPLLMIVAVIIVVLILIATVIFLFRKRFKTKPTSPPPHLRTLPQFFLFKVIRRNED